MISDGPYVINFLRPHALFGIDESVPLVHALVWSLDTNLLLFLVASTLTTAQLLERLQSALFVDVFRAASGEPQRFEDGQLNAEDLFVLA